MKRGKYKAWGRTVLCTDAGEKLSGGYIQYCVLKKERNTAWVIHRVV